ncbi:hypothetical protein TcasGA2_TC012078 [Tribolium castaneum]|uniref:Uncharacterized protein n=1 Tax=Tribolium castaneum TaxID=7070 RepID=D6X229_TRICA|nr:hypothetical protein TcasGA2_TC012078 [Tribolium castaneum]
MCCLSALKKKRVYLRFGGGFPHRVYFRWRSASVPLIAAYRINRESFGASPDGGGRVDASAIWRRRRRWRRLRRCTSSADQERRQCSAERLDERYVHARRRRAERDGRGTGHHQVLASHPPTATAVLLSCISTVCLSVPFCSARRASAAAPPPPSTCPGFSE